MKFNLRAAAVACIAMALALPAQAKPPMEAFGDVPAVRSANLSPDGTKMVFISRLDGKDYLTLYDFATGEGVPLASTTEIRARYAYFAGPDHVVLIASDQVRMEFFRGAHETSAAFSYNLKTKKLVQLLKNTDTVYPGQNAFGNVTAVDPDGKHVYMPIFTGGISNDPIYDVLKVDLDTGRSVRGSSIRGDANTYDWLVSDTGKPIARADYDSNKQILTIHAYDDGKPREIFREKQELITTGLVGVTKDGDLIVGNEDEDAGDYTGLMIMSRVDGSMKPLGQRSNADIDDVITDDSKSVVGIAYSGMFPSYDMTDPALDADLDAAVKALSGSSVHLASWNKDKSQLLLLVEGGARAERYMLFDRTNKKMSLVTYVRPDIKPEDVGEVTTVEYNARDGLKIPALVTWPTGVAKEQRKNLPTIIMPHGGPASYDAVGFDWLAQYLANEGYLVLQPNFRGSSGFGIDFEEAGHKEWGRKSQDDITDGAKALATMGWSDPNRTCIVGWSYGGYAALAGGALTPDLYKCVVSIAGVSDLRGMLTRARANGGSKGGAYKYWKDVIGDLDTDGAAIDAVSPDRLAAKFKAPVLLVHATEDANVPISQSEKMESALKGAGKEVLYIRINGDDHSLVDNDSRHKMLKVLGEFLAKHIGK